MTILWVAPESLLILWPHVLTPSPLHSDDSAHHYLGSPGALGQLLWEPSPLAVALAGGCLLSRLAPGLHCDPRHRTSPTALWLHSASATPSLATVNPRLPRSRDVDTLGHPVHLGFQAHALAGVFLCVSEATRSHSHLSGSGSSFYRLHPCLHICFSTASTTVPHVASMVLQVSTSAWLSLVTTPLSESTLPEHRLWPCLGQVHPPPREGRVRGLPRGFPGAPAEGSGAGTWSARPSGH